MLFDSTRSYPPVPQFGDREVSMYMHVRTNERTTLRTQHHCISFEDRAQRLPRLLGGLGGKWDDPQHLQ